MKTIKTLNDFAAINEAKNWPVDSIAKVNTGKRLGQLRQGSRRGFESYFPTLPSGATDGYFYFQIEKSGSMWLEGKMLYANCMEIPSDMKQVRVHKDDALPAGPEYKYFNDANILDAKILKKSLFMDGKELGMIDMDGKEAENVTEGEYIVIGVNFHLTSKLKEPVFYIKGKGRNVAFNATKTIIEGFSRELSKEQREVIAEWFAAKLGKAKIEVAGDQFKITKWTILAPRSKGYPASFSAGPFVSEQQAKDVLETINKLNEYSLFEPNNARVESEWSTLNFGLDALVDWAKTVGVKTTMKELLELRKGAVVGKKFGI